MFNYYTFLLSLTPSLPCFEWRWVPLSFFVRQFTLRIQIGNQLEDFSICANPGLSSTLSVYDMSSFSRGLFSGPRPRYRHRQSFFSRPGYLIAFVLAVCAAIYGSVVLAGPRDVGWVRVRA